MGHQTYAGIPPEDRLMWEPEPDAITLRCCNTLTIFTPSQFSTIKKNGGNIQCKECYLTYHIDLPRDFVSEV